jgi:hypothetical protein
MTQLTKWIKKKKPLSETQSEIKREKKEAKWERLYVP